MTRREFGAGAAAVAIATRTGGQVKAASTVDQNPVRRRAVAVRGLDPSRTSAGFTLFAPMKGAGTVYLVDLHGKVVYTWRMPYPPGLYGYLTGRGTLFYNGQIPNETFIGKAPFRGGAVLEADWNGRILWELRHPNHHHDGRLLKNGNVLLMCAKELPGDVISKVRGGRPGTEVNGTIRADYLVEMTKKGDTAWEWRVWEHLDPGRVSDHGAAERQVGMDPREHRFRASGWKSTGKFPAHFDSTEDQPEVRHDSVEAREPTVSGQHAPALLKNGNILIFGNGPHRVDQMFPFSRVIEVNPATNEIVWKFHEAFPPNFFSDRISNAQRLPNGKTLINEGIFGRFFEVTPAGEVVWEYVNPYFGPRGAPAGAQQNSVFRVYRYSEEEIATARTA